MRRNQFHLKNYIHEKENTKIKMKTKICLDCGSELKTEIEIIYHDCDPQLIDS